MTRAKKTPAVERVDPELAKLRQRVKRVRGLVRGRERNAVVLTTLRGGRHA